MNISVTANLIKIRKELPLGVTLVAVSKTHAPQVILEAYNLGQRVFGENKVQELVEKAEALPRDIEWHMIGHLQRNKVKFIAHFVSLIHGVDTLKLLRAINKEGNKLKRVIPCLLQIQIADEDSKFGFSPGEVSELLRSEDYSSFENVRIRGLMGMATYTDDEEQVTREFTGLKLLFDEIKTQFFADDPGFDTLSMGMSGDYHLAIVQGSTMVRIGSAIFGERNYEF